MGQRKQQKVDPSFHPFENLQKIMESRGLQIECRPAAPEQKPDAEPDEEELFRRAMSEVREIKEFRGLPVKSGGAKPRKKKPDRDSTVVRELEEIVNGARPVILSQTQEYVEWVNPLYRQLVIEKLHAGKFSVKDSVDLHGLTLCEAEAEVEEFLHQAVSRRLRCVKIIHGRGLRSPGGPVLKKALISLLSGKYRKRVMAFVTARQCDGGLGALYILLR
jgi:DNA-nicking Smr family endonuclease